MRHSVIIGDIRLQICGIVSHTFARTERMPQRSGSYNAQPGAARERDYSIRRIIRTGGADGGAATIRVE